MRNTKTVTITAENRDKGKTYFITEMSATQAEKWAARALLAMSKGGVDIDEDLMAAGAAAVIGASLKALTSMRFDDAEPLLDEMMQCVEFVGDASKPQVRRALIEDDIDETSTRLFLRGEVIEVHTGFSVRAELSKFGAAAKHRMTDSSDTPTSPPPLAPSFPPDAPLSTN